MPSNLSRRALLSAGGAALASTLARADQSTTASKLKVAIFSKHLQFLQGDALPAAAAAIGFDGIDITVRKGGHVEPERVAQDLPPLVASIRRHGLEVPMITADIVDAGTPYAEEILRSMSELGIRRYRWGGFKYDDREPYPAQLDHFKTRIAKLAALNKRYNACAMYHTHSGKDQVGAPIWDLYVLLKDFDPNAVGINYDVGHATIEGGLGGWIDSFRICGPHLRGIAVKDFIWFKGANGWQEQWVPLGEGMVRFPEFFSMVAASGFHGPLQLHFEYPLGDANNGKRDITIPREEVYAAMKRDLNRLRGYLAQAAL
jgi:sugar phosphate isomerase/epimerase